METNHLILKEPLAEDVVLLKDFEHRNKIHLANWESTKDIDNFDYQTCLSKWKKEREDRTSVRFFIFLKENPSLIIGLCNFTQIFYGPFQACYLGYKIDHDYQGKGLMFEALEKSLEYIFEELKLHRVMANYTPANLRSAKLLSRLGFQIEGHAKNYLLINNCWEDHVLTALSYEQWVLNKKIT